MTSYPGRRQQRTAPPRRTPLKAREIPRWLTWLALGSLGLAVVVLFGVFPLAGGDLSMHLVMGRWIWQHGTVPRVNEWSFVTEGAPFIAHSWLGELIFYLIEACAGTVGFMLLKLVILSAALTIDLATARLLKASWPLLMLLAPLVLAIRWAKAEFRPQLFTTLALSFMLWLLISVHTGRRSWRWLWLLPPLFATWINFHAGWIQGLGTLMLVTGAVGLMELRHRWLGRGVVSQLPCTPLLILLAVCGLALLLNPYGSELVIFPFTMQQAWVQQMNAVAQGEWSPAWTPHPWRMEGGFFIPSRVLFCGYLGLVAVVMLTSLRRWRTSDLVPVAVLALWLAHSTRHARAAADAVTMTSPFVAAALTGWWAPGRRAVLVGIGLTVALTGVALYGATVTWFAPRVGGWRWDFMAPRCIEAVIERRPEPTRLFANEHYFLYRFSPSLQLDYFWEYAAGRQATMARLAAWRHAPYGLVIYLEEYRADMLVLENIFGWIVPGLEAWGWVVIHMDDRYFMMVPHTAAAPGTAYHEIRPWGQPAPVHPGEVLSAQMYMNRYPYRDDLLTRARAGPVLAEAERILQQCPQEATFARDYRDAARRLIEGQDASVVVRIDEPLGWIPDAIRFRAP